MEQIDLTILLITFISDGIIKPLVHKYETEKACKPIPITSNG